jgi:hypothetical protein
MPIWKNEQTAKYTKYAKEGSSMFMDGAPLAPGEFPWAKGPYYTSMGHRPM